MPTFEELRQRYMFQPAEGGSLPSSGGGPAIPIRTDSRVIPHISGTSYFRAVKALLDSLSGDGAFFYTCGWWMRPDFSLDGPTASAKLVNLLIDKANDGVDVRVLGWVLAPEVLSSRIMRAALSGGGSSLDGVKHMLEINDDTMTFVDRLRKGGNADLAKRAALNVLAHPAGAVHLKYVVAGDANRTVCLSGGIDFKESRHLADWHDVQAEITGPVVADCYKAFHEMWNEVQSRPVQSLTGLRVTVPSRDAAMPAMPSRTPAAPATAKMHVQSMRTVPAMKFSTVGSLIMPTNKPVSYAPNGLFEVKPVWEKALKAADKYIYIEDQAFWSTEVFDWVNDAVKRNLELKVVLVTAPDREDTPNAMILNFLKRALTQHLVKGLTDAQIDARIGLFWHKTATIHSKTSIVDDQWAIAGSANSLRRSLYTDFEHSVAWMDEEGRAIPAYRADLWGMHLGEGLPLDQALTRWFSIPYRGAGPGASGSARVERVDLRSTAMPPVTLNADETALYDGVFDADSRQVWGPGLLGWMISKFPSLVSP